MSDALCGPSNPVQQFKHQTQLDRSLQQDRFTSRHAPVQGFRSHNPNAGLLDPEFEAFQAGVPLPDLPQYHQGPPDFNSPSQIPSWATDFQHMQISPSPVFQPQRATQAGPSNGNWAQGFREHIAQNAPRAQISPHSPQAFQHMARYGMNGFQSNFAQPSFAPAVQRNGKAPVVEQFDEAAFDRAFDQAREDMRAVDEMETDTPAYQTARREAMAALRGHQRRLSQEWEAQGLEKRSRPEELERLQDEPIVEEAMIHEENEEVEQIQQDDNDALAATAKELLEKVEHNKSDKFKNSQFLNLMRKLRDREMKVEGDQMVETAAASTATTETQLLDTAAAEETAMQGNDLREGHVFKNITTRENGRVFLGNFQYTENPLEATHVDTRPPDYNIPEQEQDHDIGRINPNDGQEVVDLLNRRGADPDDIGTSDFHLPPGVFYGDLRPRKDSSASEIDWKRWDPRDPALASANNV